MMQHTRLVSVIFTLNAVTFLQVSLSSSCGNITRYNAVLDDGSPPLVQCALSDPCSTDVLQSLLSCAGLCTSQSSCLGFNFLEGSDDCQLFCYRPNLLAVQLGCQFYEVCIN